MKSYLQTLKRNDLIKLYANFGIDAELRKSPLKLNNIVLIDLLESENILTKDIAIEFLQGSAKDEVLAAKKLSLEIANSLPSNEETFETLVVDGKEAKEVMISKRIANQAQEVQALATKMREEAMETLVVKISPISDNDIRTRGKNSEIIMFANQYFSLAKAVPFNVKCELPRCIVKLAQEAVAPVYIPFEDAETRKKTGRMGIYQLAPKYNVIVYGKADEVIESEENKKRLGI